jgi:hypothetical protein
LPKTGFCLSISIFIPIKVLISEIASVPAASTAWAMATISVTLGESLVITILDVLLFTALTTSAALSGQVPKTRPPSLTFGQEIFISKASTPSTSSFLATLP